MEIIENFLFQDGNKISITFKNRCSVELTIDSKVNKNDFKAVLREIVIPFYCEEFVSIKIYGPKGDMTNYFTKKRMISVSELVEILVAVKSLALQD